VVCSGISLFRKIKYGDVVYKLIIDVYRVFSKEQRKKLLWLQLFIIMTAFSEIISLVAIAPFMALVSDLTLIDTHTFFSKLYQLTGFVDRQDFVFFVGFCVLMILIISSIISMLTIWRLSLFAQYVGADIADTLFRFYLRQSWLYHTSVSSSYLTKQLATEVNRVTGSVISPLMQLAARSTISLLLIIAIIAYNPYIAMIGVSLFALCYIILFKVVRARLVRNGRVVSDMSALRYRMMSEGFGGIKDVLLLNKQNYFEEKFRDAGHKYAYSQGTNLALSQVPRYFMELLAFGALLTLVLYLIRAYDGGISEIFPILAVYAVAGLKLLPSFQQIYAHLAQIKGNISAFDEIKSDLLSSRLHDFQSDESDESDESDGSHSEIKFENVISLRNISFTYPGRDKPAINDLNINIKRNQIVGIVGFSGSGKSTLIDLILGLIVADKGSFYVDNVKITNKNNSYWRKLVGLVPQKIFISDSTIYENIAFGLPDHLIDNDQLLEAIDKAHLNEFVESSPLGLKTQVGEDGAQLSGGQRQRIGIARALYHRAEVLIFDEATSALDNVTERMVMQAVHEFSGHKTIIMIAHRLSTVQKCDVIYFMSKGRILDQGTYDELLSHNKDFRKMALSE
jgi:ABC-type multidrug transport system fused ATPase/permease subunit